MHTFAIYLNVVCSAVLCGVVAWIIVHPRIHEGPILKLGLILVSVGLFGVALQLPGLHPAGESELSGLLNALTLLHLGVTVSALGLVLRLRRDPRAREAWRRVTGWGEIDETAARRP